MTAKCLILFFVALLLGIFIGVHSVPPPPPTRNEITLHVDNDTNQINVSPKQGDTVYWRDLLGTPVNVQFLTTPSPCYEPKPTDHCTIKADSGYSQYQCVPGGLPCLDPGVDPRSQSAPPLVTQNKQSAVQTAGTWLYKLFGGNKYWEIPVVPLSQPVTPNTASTTSAIAKARPSSPRGTPPPVIASIACVQEKTVVTWDDPNYQVQVEQGIVWKAGQIQNFTIDSFSVNSVAVKACTESTINQNVGYRKCTVEDGVAGQTVTYRVTTSGIGACSTNPSTYDSFKVAAAAQPHPNSK